ncbi:MAG TPA: sterol desaturase family protein [Burkholderiales bacterium]|nr:sterol desaturase family protein [Burkholderiales bacterium]
MSTLPSEWLIRLTVFLGVFLAVALWEALIPRRGRMFARRARWPHNLGLLVIDALIVRLAASATPIGIAIVAQSRGWGLFHWLDMPIWAAVPLGFLLLDLTVYLQHVAFHAVPVLWRLHRVHHADVDFDVTTGVRFHPVEILISSGIKIVAVLAIGAPAIAVLAFEVLLNATALFNHANAGLPARADAILRWWVVTPDMHRVHHSAMLRETNSNFGFNLPWWDRLFGTYRAQPTAGHLGMTIGLDAFRSRQDLRLDRLLLQPFRELPSRRVPRGEAVE